MTPRSADVVERLLTLISHYDGHQAVRVACMAAVGEIRNLSGRLVSQPALQEAIILCLKSTAPFSAEKLVSHIFHLEGVLHEMQSEDGLGMAYAQGAAEERARILSLVRAMAEVDSRSKYSNNSGTYAQVVEAVKATPAAELLPPAQARERIRELEACVREALHQTREGSWASLDGLVKILRKAGVPSDG